MKLTNTIEVAPYDYAKSEYDFPNTTSAIAPSEWNEFWLKCISDSNLGRLKSIREGSYLVDIATLQFEEISEILKKELKNIDLKDSVNQVGHLCGGVVIELNGEIILEPTCCGDLSNLSGWEDIFHSELGEWHMLWVGHPWIFYRRVNGSIEFSEYTDLNLEDFNDIKAVHTLPEADLAEEIRRIRKVQDDFADKISQALTTMKIEKAKNLSRLMTSED